MALIKAAILLYIGFIASSRALLLLHIRIYYNILLLLARLGEASFFLKFLSAESRAFRLCLHILNVLRSTYTTSYPEYANGLPEESISIHHSNNEKAHLFDTNYWLYRAEILDPQKLLLDWALQNPERLGHYLIWSMNSFRYYSSKEEEQQHISYLTELLCDLNNKFPNVSLDRKDVLARNLLRFFWGSVNPSVDADLKENQIQKMMLLEKCFAALEPELDSLPRYTRKSNSFKRIGILRYTYDKSEEVIQVKNTFADLKGEDVTLIWIVFDSNKDVYETQDGPNRIIHIPTNSFVKTIDYLRELELDALVLTSPVSGKFFSEAAIIIQKRVAPVQITMIANVITTGIENMDGFVIGDVYPYKVFQSQLSEKAWVIPGFVSRLRLSTFGEEKNREALMASGTISFISNAHALKISPDLMDAWMQILSRVPSSNLTLMPFGNDAAASFKTAFLKTLNRFCESYGIQGSRLIIWDKVVGTKAVAEKLCAGHIYLDTFPYSGSASLYDSISLGLPMITCEYKYFRGMMASSMLKYVGLSKYVAKNPKEYVELSVNLATDAALYSTACFDVNQAKKKIINELDKDLSFRNYRALRSLYDCQISGGSIELR